MERRNLTDVRQAPERRNGFMQDRLFVEVESGLVHILRSPDNRFYLSYVPELRQGCHPAEIGILENDCG
jgi:hypothetical protein